MPKGIYKHQPLAQDQKYKIGSSVSALWETRRKGRTYEEIFGEQKAKAMKEKMRLAKLGRKMPWNKGYQKEAHPRWIKDRTLVLEKHRLRGTHQWKEWRRAVFERDGYICQSCAILGGYLEPHHIEPLRFSMGKIFDLTNGITLCRPCHIKTMGKESSFVEHFTQLLAAAQI